MPIDYKKYHPDWKKIRSEILERENGCCKFCGVENYARGFRDKSGNFYEYPISEIAERFAADKKVLQIVLTIAHLDHNIDNNDYDNLAALCQRCHLRYDAKHHAKNSKATREMKK